MQISGNAGLGFRWECRFLGMQVLVKQMRERDEEEEDIFDSVVNLEGSHLQQGFDDGFRDGVAAGKEEGREVGLKTGFELGEEIGFYRGCCDVWKAAIEKDANAFFSARAQRNVRQFDEQLISYPLLNPQDERLQDLVDTIRAKFRAIMSMLSIHLDYEGYPKRNLADDASF